MICVLAALGASLSALSGGIGAPERVVLHLNWKHQYQFAGYYAAVEKGFYRDRGLDVVLREANSVTEPIETVVNGQASFGISGANLVVARSEGVPVVALGALFQHSPSMLIIPEGGPVNSVQDLVGKRVMLEPHAFDVIALMAFEGVPTSRVELVSHSFDIAPLVRRDVAAMSGYLTDEPFELERRGFKYRGLRPAARGIDFYGDVLFTSQDEIGRHRRRVEDFIAASRQGWQYALSHREEIIEILLSKYKSRRSREYLEFEAERMAPLIAADIVPIGFMYEGRWRDIEESFRRLGLLSSDVDLRTFVFTPSGPKDLLWWHVALIGALFVVALIAMMQISHALLSLRDPR